MRTHSIPRTTGSAVVLVGALLVPLVPQARADDVPPADPAPTTVATAAAAMGTRALVPKPVAVHDDAGTPFRLGPHARIVARGGARAVGNYLGEVLRPATGYRLPVTSGRPGPGDLVLDLGAGKGPAGHTAEGYNLRTGANTATIAADTRAGLFNGVQTLRQLFGPWMASRERADGPWTAPATTISDYPRFGYRGAMLDVARSFQTPAEVKRYIDDIAQFKVNTLHLHLADDQAWRIVIDDPASNPSGLDYDALTRVASHGGADVFGGTGKPLGTEDAHRGFYTKAQYRSIVAYAASRFVTVVPEIDGPGHTNAALASIPQLNPDGKVKPMNNTADVGYSTLDANSPVTYEFLSTVWAQLAAMTPGPYLHMGGDEAHVTGHDNYLTYVRKTLPIVTALGKLPMGWQEYAAIDLPPGSVVQVWSGDIAPVLAQVARGAKVVMSPAATAYVDMKYNPSTPIGLTWACSGDCDWNKYYDWNPVQRGLTESDVLGVEAPLWSETVRGIEQAEFLAFPRLIANAEIGWTPQAQRDVTDFGARLAAIGGLLTLEGTNFYASPKAAWTVDARGENRTVRRGEPLAGEIARFTAPAAGSPGTVSVSIDYGDGSAAVAGTVVQPRPATSLRSHGVFEVVSPAHRYGTRGTYRATVSITVAGEVTTAGFDVVVR